MSITYFFRIDFVSAGHGTVLEWQQVSEEFETKGMVRELEGSWRKWQSRNIQTRAEAEEELKFLARTVERMMSV